MISSDRGDRPTTTRRSLSREKSMHAASLSDADQAAAAARWSRPTPTRALGSDAAAPDDPARRPRASSSARAEAAGYTDLWTGETNGPDGFTPLALAAAWTERGGSAPASSASSSAARRCSPSRRRRSPTRAAGASCSGSAPRRIASSRAGTGSRSRSPLSKISETIDFLRPALAGERTAERLQARVGARRRCRSSSPRCAARCCGSRSRRPTARSPTSCRSSGLPSRSPSSSTGAARGVRAPLPVLLPAGRARAGRAAGPLHVRLLRHRAGLRGLLPLARPRRGDRRDVRGAGRPRTATARPRRRRGS